MNGRQFVAVEFRSGGRPYTYHNDGAPVWAGAVVKVPERSGDGWQRATAVSISDEEPAFATKGILGLVEESEGPSGGFPPSDLPEPGMPRDLFAPR